MNLIFRFKHKEKVDELLEKLDKTFDFVERVECDIPIRLHTFQEVTFEDDHEARNKAIDKIAKYLEDNA